MLLSYIRRMKPAELHYDFKNVLNLSQLSSGITDISIRRWKNWIEIVCHWALNIMFWLSNVNLSKASKFALMMISRTMAMTWYLLSNIHKNSKSCIFTTNFERFFSKLQWFCSDAWWRFTKKDLKTLNLSLGRSPFSFLECLW